MNSWNPIQQAGELKTHKELLLVYPWWQTVKIQIVRAIGVPKRYKIALYDLALALLPAAAALCASFSLKIQPVALEWEYLQKLWSENEDWRAGCVAFASCILLLSIATKLTWAAEFYTCGRTPHARIFFAYVGLILLGIASSLVDEFLPLWKLFSAIAIAVLIALYSQYVLILPKKYREDAMCASTSETAPIPT
ncbi:hypothetical protein ACTXJJ_10950 [Corynebacterium casei]|uniref:hypothetical protein n=1 Tax=Corynebacterium casei TaxID=160386 RepID=UPI003FD44145